jgi:hypothetical protein
MTEQRIPNPIRIALTAGQLRVLYELAPEFAYTIAVAQEQQVQHVSQRSR